MKLEGNSRRPMSTAFGLLCIVFLATSALAGSVVDSGFCLSVAGRDCTSRLSSGQQISIEALERDESGQRILYFQSTQTVSRGELFVHTWERTGGNSGRAKPKIYSRRPLSEETQQRVEAFRLGLLDDPLHVVMEANADSKTYRAVSSRYVSGPGKFVGKVVDSAGQDFPGTQLQEVEIVP